MKLDCDLSGKSIGQTLYKSIIGSMLYLIASRLDIPFSVGVCARFQNDTKKSHLSAIRRIILYVNGTVDHGVPYSKNLILILSVTPMLIRLEMPMIGKASMVAIFISVVIL